MQGDTEGLGEGAGLLVPLEEALALCEGRGVLLRED